jgi:hypothetical protein
MKMPNSFSFSAKTPTVQIDLRSLERIDGRLAIRAARRDPDLQRFYRRKLVQKGLGKARAASLLTDGRQPGSYAEMGVRNSLTRPNLGTIRGR